MKTIIRIKRRADEEPAENIIVKAKRPRFSEPGSAVAFALDVKPTILSRVTTIESPVHASHQGNIVDIELGEEGGARSKEDLSKKLHVEGNKKVIRKSDDESESSSSEIQYLNIESIHQMEDVIFCNDEPLKSEKYVFDIFYASDDVNWAEYVCDIQKHSLDDEMLYYDPDDEDDENDESNWRNDYPEEEDDISFEDEEDY